MKHRYVYLAGLLLICAVITGYLLSRHFQVTERDPAYWASEILAYEEKDKVAFPGHGKILFLGSSSIRRWQTLSVDMLPFATLNRGFGGARLSHVIHYAERIILPYQPDTIVIYAGENDLRNDGQTPEEVFALFQQLVDYVQLRLPATHVFFVSIKPRVKTDASWQKIRTQTNEMIESFTDTDDTLHFIDVSPAMLDDNGVPIGRLYLEDGVHMTSAGYALWAGIIKSALVSSKSK